MATPVIGSVVVSPAIVAPGGAFTISVQATDPDNKVYQFQGNAVDAGGNKAPFAGQITVSDPLTYELTLPAGFTFAQRPNQPGVFDCVAP